MDKILEVKNLKVSFRTQGGTVKAVRDISFDLERGKTLAIVGESGSGKSVTSKAILGILAGNSIIEGGEILYDGKDLLSITEDEMYKIRGDKISMIFQDPLSSLNPIVKIGRQITEAMLLKNKANRKEARNEFNSLLRILKSNMIAAQGQGSEAEITEMIKTFDGFATLSTKLEMPYNDAMANAEEIKASVEDLLFMVEKKQNPDVREKLTDYVLMLQKVQNEFIEDEYAARLTELLDKHKKEKDSYPKKAQDNVELSASLEKLLNDTARLMDDIISQPRPNFFRIGYYKLKGKDCSIKGKGVEKLNEEALTFLNDNFMNHFLELEDNGIRYSFENALENKKKLLPKLEEAKKYYEGSFTKAEAKSYAKTLADLVPASIDQLEINKDSVAYTFRSSLNKAIDKYFSAQKTNPKEEARFASQSAKREKLIAKGKTVDWKVVPKSVYDLDELKADIVHVVTRLEEKYKAEIAAAENFDVEARGIEIVDFFKTKASQVVYKVTKAMAKEKAIKLMEEVGIHEPRRRYNQYPFEFSGGMRQRIVIAIALAANPDILICDEPTTALDVTIQAQILELINQLKVERNLSVIFITHDLGVVANMADEIAVMYAGKIVEYGTAQDIFYDPRHPYTWALLSSMPDLDTSDKLDAIPGTPPNMIYPPVGDAFADRNKYAMKIDFEKQPPMFKVSDTHVAATWLLHPNAPKVEIPKIITDRIARMKQKSAGGEI